MKTNLKKTLSRKNFANGRAKNSSSALKVARAMISTGWRSNFLNVKIPPVSHENPDCRR
jgi:hypothetical protein